MKRIQLNHFCCTLAYRGCRIREALGGVLIFERLKIDQSQDAGPQLRKGRLALVAVLLGGLVLLASRTPAVLAQAIVDAPVASKALEGRVVEDGTGSPIAAAEWRFHKAGWRELAADLESDGSGRFRADGLPAGEYRVDVSKPNYLTASFTVQVPGNDLFVRLVRYGVLDGQVSDAMGRPLSGRILGSTGMTAGGARIVVMAQQPGSGKLRRYREAEVERAGHFRIFDLPPGRYALALFYSGQTQGGGMQFYPENARPRIFAVSGGEEYRDINFLVASQPGYSVSGKIAILKKGNQFQLALGRQDQPLMPIAQTLADPDGAFRFEKVPPGSYDLFAAGPMTAYAAFDILVSRDEGLFGRTQVQVSGQNVEGLSVSLQPGKSLRVLLKPHGGEARPPGCSESPQLELESLEPWGVRFAADIRGAFTQAQTIKNLAPGRFRVSASGLGKGCYAVSEPVADLSGAEPEVVVVEVAAAGAIQGLLQPARADVAVVLLDREGTAGAEAQLAFPNAEGQFLFEGLRPGHYRSGARRASDAPGKSWVANDSAMIDVEVVGGKPTRLELPSDVQGGRP